MATASLGTFDYVIVGAGSAGCVLANRLSRDADRRVLLLEAGGEDDYFWIKIPVGYLYTIGNPRTDWCFRTEPDEGLNGRTLGYARGKVLGGCSSINAMIYMRGQASDYDHWTALGNRGWSWKEVLPYFTRVEDYAHGADELHGAGGELRVEERRVSWEILDAWRNAAEECGIPKIPEFNRGDNFGSAYFQVNQTRGVRLKWHVQPLSLDTFGEPLHPFPAITPSVCNLRPTSRGYVRLTSTDPEAHPAIKLNYLATAEDRRVTVDAMRFTRRIMAARALSRYRPEEWKPGPAVQSDEQLIHAAGDLGTTIFHPVGTCKMGSDPLAVVDDRLAVRGVAGLRVIDASIMPRITSGNTNAPTVMIAENGAEMVREDGGRGV